MVGTVTALFSGITFSNNGLGTFISRNNTKVYGGAIHMNSGYDSDFGTTQLIIATKYSGKLTISNCTFDDNFGEIG